MLWRTIVVAIIASVAAPAAAQSEPVGVVGMPLPAGSGTRAAAWRHGGAQVVTVDRNNNLLFWDAKADRLIDYVALSDLPPQPRDESPSDRVRLLISPDDSHAAMSVQGKNSTVMVVIDLAAQHVTSRLDRPALFWTAAGLIAGPHAGCSTACDFALIDSATGGERSLGTHFGDGEHVAATLDGRTFATVVERRRRLELTVWSSMTWTALAWTPIEAQPVEVGFDAGGTRAFGRLATPSLTILNVLDGSATTMPLPDWARQLDVTTDLDGRQFMTSRGPLPFDTTLMRISPGKFLFYSRDPRFGAVYEWNSGAAGAIGGRRAESNTVPWQVELQYRAPPGSTLSNVVLHNCGGSLIKSGWVVTATHCFLTADNVLRSDAEAIAHTVVRAGATNLDGDMASFDIAEIYIRRCREAQIAGCFHDYDPHAQPPMPPVDDITLLRIVPHIDPPVVRSYTVRAPQIGAIEPIKLPPPHAVPVAATPVTMTGWGAVSADGATEHRMSPVLNRIDIAVVPRETCSARHGFGPLAPTVICAGSADDRQLACRGDSGGPLVANIADQPVLVGIVSWGSCSGGPAIYTRVAAYVPWIEATISAAEKRR